MHSQGSDSEQGEIPPQILDLTFVMFQGKNRWEVAPV